MFPYNNFYGYPPQYPQQMQMPPSPSDLERGMKIAMKLRAKEDRKEAKKKEDSDKNKSAEKKKAEEARHKNLSALEWFILGILAYPFVGPLYNYVTHLAGVK